MEILFYNIFLTSDFKTEIWFFECIFDSSKIKNKKINTVTHIFKPSGNIDKSILFNDDSKTILDDYCFLLSIFQWKYVYYNEFKFLPRLSEVNDFELFLSDEVWDFLSSSIWNLVKIKSDNPALFGVVSRGLFLYYEAKYLLIYNNNSDLYTMHLFEFILGSFYRINGWNDKDVYIDKSYSFLIKELWYQKIIDSALKKELKFKLSKYKKEDDISLEVFKKQFNDMRNWIQHWKQDKKPNFWDSPSDLEFTFNYRLESFIRVILSDLIYQKDYKRKIDILFQLILEKNVCFMPSQEFSNKSFKNKD